MATSIEYESIFSSFLGYIDDYELASYTETSAYELMGEYLHKTVAEPYVRRLFSSISLDDDEEVVNFEMSYVVDEESDSDFVETILSKGMVVKWLEPQVKSKLLTAQMFAGKESKWYSQQAHLAELRNLLTDVKADMRGQIRDRGYIYNSYLEES